MGRKKQITMQDIADKMGISNVTVSKALNNKEGVSLSLKNEIKKMAKKLGYTPSTAKGFNLTTKNIAIMVQDKFINTNEYITFYLKFYQRIAKALNDYGYICNLISIDHKHTKPDYIASILNNSTISGIIIMGYIKKEFINIIKMLHIPIIFLDYYDSLNSTNCILTDSYYSSYEITNYLLKMGHKKIGFVGRVKSTSSIQDRFLGYCRAMLEKNLPIEPQFIVDDRDEEGDEIDICLPKILPTAFVCNCDDSAFKTVKVLNENGYDVPEDISIVGFDNDFNAERCVPKLTTVVVDTKTMVQKAIRFLIDKIEGNNEIDKAKIFISGKIIYRDSVKNITEK